MEFATRRPTTAALVIEIAVSSAGEDRALATLYAEAGVEEYWIVLPVEGRVEILLSFPKRFANFGNEDNEDKKGLASFVPAGWREPPLPFAGEAGQAHDPAATIRGAEE